jgi:multimeric flavodoxin WrbA
MRALILNCTLKASPEQSNTEALLNVVAEAMRQDEIDVDVVRVVDHTVKPGVSNDEGDGDAWPTILALLRNAEILVIATPTWLGQPSSIAKRVLERMDALISETDDQGRPFAYNRVGGIVVTGNEDGAHHVISEVSGALIDIGYTIPGQAWTYWNTPCPRRTRGRSRPGRAPCSSTSRPGPGSCSRCRSARRTPR